MYTAINVSELQYGTVAASLYYSLVNRPLISLDITFPVPSSPELFTRVLRSVIALELTTHGHVVVTSYFYMFSSSTAS